MKSKWILVLFFGIILFSCSKNHEKITDISQLKDKRICVLTGSAGDLAARKVFPNAKYLDMIGSADAGLAVKTEKADAFIYDKSILQRIVFQNPELTILDKSISKLELAIAIEKENLQLLSEMNEALNLLRNKGVLDELKNKWIETNYTKTPPLPVKKILEKWYFENGNMRNL
jgi:polar amino acid transport system substrate-binding protein